MKVLIFLPPCTLQESVSSVLTTREFSVETAESATECLECARLGEYEAILLGVDNENYGDVLIVVELLRQNQPYATLFIFERNLDLDQRFRLFDAGVDDCVCEPFFPQEFAVRLEASIRLRHATSRSVSEKVRYKLIPKAGGSGKSSASPVRGLNLARIGASPGCEDQ